MSDPPRADEAAIDTLAAMFFGVFDNRSGHADAGRLHALCIPAALFVKALGQAQDACGIDEFVAPRERLLNEGRLLHFHEEELAARTELFGNIAQRWCRYRKAGILDGIAFETDGMKSLQLLRTPQGWRISAVLWDDEPA